MGVKGNIYLDKWNTNCNYKAFLCWSRFLFSDKMYDIGVFKV